MGRSIDAFASRLAQFLPSVTKPGAEVRPGTARAQRGHDPAGADIPVSIAFVLSGGASLGAIQVGMLRALAERDIRPEMSGQLGARPRVVPLRRRAGT
jgi:hypothetical protein